MADTTGKIGKVIASGGASLGAGSMALELLSLGHPISAGVAAVWAVKPIREAISRLISGATDLPEAWLYNKKLKIEAQGRGGVPAHRSSVWKSGTSCF